MRIYLAYHNWPLPDSDEGVMGIMAINILKYGERPVIFYGQNYMGVLQAYFGAVIFQFLDSSVFGLRLGMVALYAAFLLCIYLLTRQLYSKRFALFMMLLFAFGSTAMLSRQLMAIGGYPETVLFSTASLVLGVRLALTSSKHTVRDRIKRQLMFFLWGVAVSIGVWSDMLILPWVALSGVVLLFSWREIIFKGAIFSLLLGLLLGSTPLIIYNLGALPGQHSLTVLLLQVGHVPVTVAILKQQIKNTFTISLPIISGSPVCLKAELSYLQYWGFDEFLSSQCTLIGTIWSVCYLTLWISSITLVALTLKKLFFPWRGRSRSLEERRQIVSTSLQGILNLGIMASILPYLHSAMVLSAPGQDARYLIGVWVGFPALVWPLWRGVAHVDIEHHLSNLLQILLILRRTLCFSFLILLLTIFVAGSVIAVRQVPTAHYEQVREQNIVNTLLAKGVTHIYADYWFDYRITFASNTRIVCAAIVYNYRNNHEVISGQNRYLPYFNAVKNDPDSSYVIPADSDERLKHIIAQRLRAINYHTFVVEGYLIYQPIHANKKRV